jgi:hypothetical protein
MRQVRPAKGRSGIVFYQLGFLPLLPTPASDKGDCLGNSHSLCKHILSLARPVPGIEKCFPTGSASAGLLVLA